MFVVRSFHGPASACASPPPILGPVLFGPVLFGFAPDRRCRRILGLLPIPARPLALGHNPLTTKGTGVLEEQRAVVLKQRIEQAPIARSGLLTATEDGAGRL